MITLRGKTWWADFYDAQGNRVRKTLRTSDKKEAKELAAKLMAGVKGHDSPSKRSSYGPSLSDAYKRAQREFASWRDSKDQKTIEKNKRAVLAYFKEDRSLHTIDREAVMGFAEDMRERGLAASTINARLSQLSVLFKLASEDWGFIRLVVPKMPRSKPSPGRKRRLSPEEEAAMIRLLEASDKAHHRDVADLVRVLVDTGMRLNEAIGITKETYDLSSRVIVSWENKTDHPRGIPMTQRVVDVLKAREGYTRPFVMLTDNIASKAWLWARNELGLGDDTEFVLHTLRHTVGSRLADAGVDAFRIKEMLGHKSIATTQKYIHVSAAGLRGLTDVLTSASSVSLEHERDSDCDQSSHKEGVEDVREALLDKARVVKQVDAGDSKSPAARRVGSSPTPGTNTLNDSLAALSAARVEGSRHGETLAPVFDLGLGIERVAPGAGIGAGITIAAHQTRVSPVSALDSRYLPLGQFDATMQQEAIRGGLAALPLANRVEPAEARLVTGPVEALLFHVLRLTEPIVQAAHEYVRHLPLAQRRTRCLFFYRAIERARRRPAGTNNPR